MIGELCEVSLDYFDPNPAYWSKKVIFRQKIAIFGLRCPKMAFSHKWKNQFLAEISANLEYSRKIFFQKKLVTLPDTPHKYHINRAITLEDIQKWNSDIFFFRPHSTALLWNSQILRDSGILC